MSRKKPLTAKTVHAGHPAALVKIATGATPANHRRATAVEIEQMLRSDAFEHGSEEHFIALDQLLHEAPEALGRVMNMPMMYVDQLRESKFGTDLFTNFACPWCPLTTTDPAVMVLHLHDVLEEDMSAIPNHPSNRTVLKKLKEHGCELGKANGEFQRVVLPDGNKLEVRTAHCHTGNTTHILQSIYSAFGTSDEFWSGPKKEDPPQVPTIKKVERDRGHTNKCMDILSGQQRPMSIGAVAEMTGITHGQAGTALAHLVNVKAAKRVKNGVYEALPRPASQHSVGIDISVGGQDAEPVPTDGPVAPLDGPLLPPDPIAVQRVPVPMPSPYVPQEDDVEELVSTALDLIFPSGFRGKHLPAVMAWREATIELVRVIKADGS